MRDEFCYGNLATENSAFGLAIARVGPPKFCLIGVRFRGGFVLAALLCELLRLGAAGE